VRRIAFAVAVASAAAVVALAAAGCHPGGSYEPTGRPAGAADRGETNGRMFDFVSNKPDGDDWQIRIRDSSMWAAYASGTDEKQLGTVNLDATETRRIWKLIDALELGERKKGKKDDDEGWVQLRLREPGGEEGHEVISIYVSRATEDEDVLGLGAYLQKLLMKYHKKDADF
jgi:hypothetical protein